MIKPKECIIIKTFREQMLENKQNPLEYLNVQNMVNVFYSLEKSNQLSDKIDTLDKFLDKAFDIKYATLGDGVVNELKKDNSKTNQEKLVNFVKNQIFKDAKEYAEYVVFPELSKLVEQSAIKEYNLPSKVTDYKSKFINIFSKISEETLKNLFISPGRIKKNAGKRLELNNQGITEEVKDIVGNALIAVYPKYQEAMSNQYISGSANKKVKFASKFIQNTVLRTLMYRSFVFDKPYSDILNLDEVGEVFSVDTAQEPIYVSQDALSALYGWDVSKLDSTLKLRYTDFGLYIQAVKNKDDEVTGYYIYHVEDPTDTSKYVKIEESPVSEENVLKIMDNFIKENLENQTDKHNYQYAIISEFIMSKEKDPQKIIDFITKGNTTIKTASGEIKVTKEYLESLVKRVEPKQKKKTETVVYQKDEYAHIRPTKTKVKLTDEEVEYFNKLNDIVLDFFDAELKVQNAFSKMYSSDFLYMRFKFAEVLTDEKDDGVLSSTALDRLTPEKIKEIAEELDDLNFREEGVSVGVESEILSSVITPFEANNEYNNILNTMLDVLYAYRDQLDGELSRAEFTRDLIEKIRQVDIAFASKESSLKETTNPYERASGVIRDVLYRKIADSGKVLYFENKTQNLNDRTQNILMTIKNNFSVDAFTKYLIQNPKEGEAFMKALRRKFYPENVQFIKNTVEFFFGLKNNGENLRPKEEIKKFSYTYYPLFEVYAKFANKKLLELGIDGNLTAKDLLPVKQENAQALINKAIKNVYRNALASDVVPYSLLKDSFIAVNVLDTFLNLKTQLLERMGAMTGDIMKKINFIREGSLEVKKEYNNLNTLREIIEQKRFDKYVYENFKRQAKEGFKDIEGIKKEIKIGRKTEIITVSDLASLRIIDLQDQHNNYTQALAKYLNTKWGMEIDSAYKFLSKLKPNENQRSDIIYLRDMAKTIAAEVKGKTSEIDEEIRNTLRKVSLDIANKVWKSKQHSFKELKALEAKEKELIKPLEEKKAKVLDTVKELSDLFKTIVKDPNLSISNKLVKVNLESLLRSNSLEDIVDKMLGADYILINRLGKVVKRLEYPTYSPLTQVEAQENKRLQDELLTTRETEKVEVSDESVRLILRTIQEQVVEELPDTVGNTEFQMTFLRELDKEITRFRKKLIIEDDFLDSRTYHEKMASVLPELIKQSKLRALRDMRWLGTNFNADMNKLKEVDYLSPLYRRETAQVAEDIRPSFEDVVATVQKVVPVIEQIAGKDVLNLKVLKNIRFNNQFTFEDLAKTLVLCYGYDAKSIQNMTVSEMMNELDKIHGYFTKRADAGFAGTIVLSANIKNLDSVPITAFHEAFHFIQTLLSPQERNVLKQKFGERWIEESAEAFALFVIEERAIESSIIRNIFKKIMNFLRKMHSSLTGFRNEMDIFRDAYEGKYAPSSSIDLKTFSETGVNAEDGVLLSMKSALNKKDNFIQTSKNFENQERLLAGRKGIEDNFYSAILGRIRRGFKEYIIDGFFRGVFPKIASKETARELEQLRRALEIPKVATLKATRDIKDITKNLSNYERTVMERLLILRDVVKNHDNGIQSEESILAQWDNIYNSIDEIREHLKELESQKTPNVIKALEKREALYKTMLKKLKDAGYIKTDDLNSMEYFHRLVLRYHKMKTKLTPNKMKMLFTSALQPRTDTDLPFVTDYIYSEFEAFSQMYALLEYDNVINNINEISSDKVQGAIDRFVTKLTKEMEEAYQKYLVATTPSDKRKYNGRYQTIKKRLEYKSYYHPDQLKNIIRNDPELRKEGYDVYNLTDNHIYYDVFTMDKNIIRDIMSQEGIKTHSELKEGISKRKAVRKFDKIVIAKTEVIDTMKDMFKPTETSPLAQIFQKIQTYYKLNTLLNPFNALRYLTNNTSGDIDIVLAYDYKILGYAKEAFLDLLDYFKNDEKMSVAKRNELDNALAKGIINSGISVHELPELYSVPNIKQIVGEKDDRWFKRILNYPEFISKVNNIRESTLRLATYRYFNDKLSQNPDTPIYAASNRHIIDGLKTKEEKVSRLSRDLIGDYGNISPNGRWLRKTLIPFWSWMEVNVPRYTNLLRNANKEYTGKAAAALIGLQTGKAAMKMASLYAGIILYNALRAPDDSDELLNNSYGQLRLIVFNDSDGVYSVVRFQGAFSDALSWFIEDPIVTMDGMLKGKLSTAEVMQNVLTTAPKKIFQGLSPFLKAPVELYLGMTTFPRPRAIRDNAEYVANLLGMRTPYRVVNPSIPKKSEERGLYNSLKELVASSALRKFDSREVAYFKARDLASKFAEENNLNTARILPNKKSTAAYLFKKSMKYQDYDAAVLHLTKYLELGGSRAGLQQSLRVEHPLYSIDKKYRHFFLKTLPEDDRKLFSDAVRWYESIYLASFNNSEFERVFREAQRKAKKPEIRPLYAS